uniref:Uncharacterized protein n=1 Tax=Chromulina nebulosa TaxID=96789 RepID=A0A7S0T189_9STRA|mmetsp:Transcript_58/g.53  ORF Transcript_58/g.53 Transcript_58/m.53 type:complete len:171 (+) Transcript_58:185-697(+)
MPVISNNNYNFNEDNYVLNNSINCKYVNYPNVVVDYLNSESYERMVTGLIALPGEVNNATVELNDNGDQLTIFYDWSISGNDVKSYFTDNKSDPAKILKLAENIREVLVETNPKSSAPLGRFEIQLPFTVVRGRDLNQNTNLISIKGCNFLHFDFTALSNPLSSNSHYVK